MENNDLLGIYTIIKLINAQPTEKIKFRHVYYYYYRFRYDYNIMD